MQRASVNGKWAVVTAGAVSVAPHDPVTGTGWPAARTASSPSRSRSAAGSAAAALNISRRRQKNRAANTGSASSAGTSWAYPAGTLKYTVGGTSARFCAVWPNSAGTGRPASMYSVPPLLSTMFRLWLPPKVWLHGSQSTMLGGQERPHLPDHLLVDGQHPVRVQHTLGRAGRPRGEQDLGHTVRLHRGRRRRHGRARRGGQQAGERLGPLPGAGAPA